VNARHSAVVALGDEKARALDQAFSQAAKLEA